MTGVGTPQTPRTTAPDAAPETSAPGVRMGFVGVSTSASSIMRIFPRWAEELGLGGATLVGHDLEPGSPPEAYRALVGAMPADPGYRGALVTTHKIDLYEAAADLFAEVDDFARLCGEVSSISVRDGRLRGHAKDPLTAGLSLEEILAPDHFARTGADAVCLGAGGAGTAITWCLGRREDRPRRLVCTDTRPERLDALRRVHERGGLDTTWVEYRCVDGPADELVGLAAPGSLVVNATGLGKDRPGSPLGASVRYPRGAVVWELNYRGSLELYHHARAQAVERELVVVDGWRYFVHGWSQVVAEVFGLHLTPETVERLATVAEELR